VGTARAVACCFRRPRRKLGRNLGDGAPKIPARYRTLNPAAGQRGRSPEHARARVLPVSNIDLFPTFADAAEIPEDKILHGESLRPLRTDELL